MRIKLSRDNDGIWEEITEPHGNSGEATILPVLKKPNHYQTRIKFVEQWIVSKLLYGNAYILKQRDRDRNVVGLYVLHPNCVKPLVAENGDVYYELTRDDLSEVKDTITVPASEMIHDMMVSLWHPLIGVSPLYACSISATMGNKIQNNSTNTFANGARPSGIITVPGAITNETAQTIKATWETNFGGTNVGRTAVLADGLKFDLIPLMSAELMQLIEQLRWTVEDVARAFRYPLWMLGGPMPPYTRPEMAMTAYYSQCLHPHIENFELCLDEGLGLGDKLGTELDLDTLMRMDRDALYESLNKASAFMEVDEQRHRANLRPTEGGAAVYRQEQDHSLAALAKRDAREDPFASKSQASSPQPAALPPAPEPSRSISSSQEDLTVIRDAIAFRLRRKIATA